MRVAIFCLLTYIRTPGLCSRGKFLPAAWLALICGLTNTKIEFEEPFSIAQRLRKDYALEETKGVIEQAKGNLKAH